MSITGGYSYLKFISSVVVFPDNYFSRSSKIRWSSTGIKNTKCLRLIDDKSHSVPRELWVTIVSSLCHERGNYFYDDKNCDTNTNIILPLAIQQAVVVENGICYCFLLHHTCMRIPLFRWVTVYKMFNLRSFDYSKRSMINTADKQTNRFSITPTYWT